jgi:hypothetical protein
VRANRTLGDTWPRRPRLPCPFGPRKLRYGIGRIGTSMTGRFHLSRFAWAMAALLLSSGVFSVSEASAACPMRERTCCTTVCGGCCGSPAQDSIGVESAEAHEAHAARDGISVAGASRPICLCIPDQSAPPASPEPIPASARPDSQPHVDWTAPAPPRRARIEIHIPLLVQSPLYLRNSRLLI